MSKLEAKLGTATNPPTIDNVWAELCLSYAHKKAMKSLSETKRKILEATRRYKRTYTFCRKIGHKATDCYARKNEEKARDNSKNDSRSRNTHKGEWNNENVCLYKDNKCFFCKKPGHKLQDCRQIIGESELVNVTQENAFMAMTMKSVLDSTWIANSGATCHKTNDPTRMYDITYIETPVTLGNSSTVTTTMNRKLKLQIEGEEESMTVTLHNVKYILGFMLKLFSLSCTKKKGAQLCNKIMTLSGYRKVILSYPLITVLKCRMDVFWD